MIFKYLKESAVTVMTMTCSLFVIPDAVSLQVAAAGFIIGAVQYSVETVRNFSSVLLLSASAKLREWRKQGRGIKW